MPKSFPQKPRQIEKILEFIEEDLENVKRVKKICQKKELDVEFVVHAKSETVQESVENTDVKPGQIVKTLLFKTGEGFVAVLCPGSTSVSEEKLEDITNSGVEMASPSEVKEVTGYTVGGVSPFDLDIKVLMEESLLNESFVKPAAGSRVVGIKINPEELKEVVSAEVVDIAR
jgi:prolyl-tRNA editing enzyme YbaK/EbsC (Cys-tRNA(Pro) deacylase)